MKVLPIDTEVLISCEQLVRPNERESFEQLRSDRVVAALAAVQRHQHDACAILAAQSREDTAVLVIRMSRAVQHARGRAEFLDLLPRAGCPRVLGDEWRL